MRNNLKILVIGLIFLVGFLTVITAAIPTFNQFYGTISNETGSPIKNNVSVIAYFNNTILERSVSDKEFYGYSDIFLAEGASNGDIISFYVDYHFAVNYTFINEESTLLNLVLNNSQSVLCVDTDFDGYYINSMGCGTTDCNDDNSAVSPGASEVCSNGIDDDCDGSIDEDCGGEDNDGGGGGSYNPDVILFNLDKTEIATVLDQGTSKEIEFTILNKGTAVITPAISVDNSQFITLETVGGFVLNPGESKVIKATIIVENDTNPDLYLRTITVQAGSIQKDILISVEVVSAESLFDVVLVIPKEYLYVLPGQNMNFDLTLLRMISTNTNDVLVKYIIKDVDGNEVFTLSEDKVIVDREEYVKEIPLPADMVFGKYIAYVQLEYEDKIASSSGFFNVGSANPWIKSLRFVQPYVWWIIIGVLAVAIVMIIISIILYARKRKSSM